MAEFSDISTLDTLNKLQKTVGIGEEHYIFWRELRLKLKPTSSKLIEDQLKRLISDGYIGYKYATEDLWKLAGFTRQPHRPVVYYVTEKGIGKLVAGNYLV